jgi:hypothetical protein
MGTPDEEVSEIENMVLNEIYFGLDYKDLLKMELII